MELAQKWGMQALGVQQKEEGNDDEITEIPVAKQVANSLEFSSEHLF